MSQEQETVGKAQVQMGQQVDRCPGSQVGCVNSRGQNRVRRDPGSSGDKLVGAGGGERHAFTVLSICYFKGF